MNAFILELSFILWLLLGAITCGIVMIFWVLPYMYCTLAEFYRVVMGEFTQSEPEMM